MSGDTEGSKFRHLRNRRPIDALARRVTAPAERHDVGLIEGESETPLPMWPWCGPGCKKANDLTGTRRGLMTIMGYAGDEGRYRGPGMRPKSKSGRGSRWVARCVCGTYAYRRSKRWKTPGWDACSRCRAKNIGPGVVT